MAEQVVIDCDPYMDRMQTALVSGDPDHIEEAVVGLVTHAGFTRPAVQRFWSDELTRLGIKVVPEKEPQAPQGRRRHIW